MADIILSKQSTSDEIKAYFNLVVHIIETSREEFPINLDSVWPLVYGRKEEAVRALISDPQFMESVDYQVLRKNAENPLGGRPSNEYYLSVPCLEYFIARKVRAVFEVYRQVFHKTRKMLQLHAIPANPQLQFVQTQMYLADALSERLRLNDASRLGMYQSIAAPYGLAIPQYVPSKGIHKSAKDLLEEMGKPMSVIRFNTLLEDQGYLETKTRTSKGGVKKFKSITAKGEHYGENQVSPKNQNETQPHWYADKFMELYNLVTA